MSTLTAFASAADNVVNQVGTGISNAADKVGDAIENVGNAADDTAITTKVKTLLALESDIPMSISVTTKNNVVYLTGVVDTRIQANRVIQIAQSVDGVRDVNDSKLQITSSDSFFSDASITAKAKGKIMQLENSKQIAPNADLHVETTNGEVHIFGTVGNSDDRSVIEKSVAAISGVKAVKLNIDVADKQS